MDFRLGRVFGIPVEINISWIFVFILLSYVVGFGYIALVHPILSNLQVIGFGAGAALLLFLCVLAHELSHALAARRFGIRTHAITLFLLGAFAQLEDEPDTWQGEMSVALAGPALSVLCSVFFAGLWFALPTSSIWATVVFYLAFANVFLAALNLMPGLPLDGGRVLRSVLWRAFDNRLGATHFASRAGSVIGLAAAAFGAVILVGDMDPAGLWLIFIGWFVSSSASECWKRELERATPEEARRYAHRLIQVRQSGPMLPRLR